MLKFFETDTLQPGFFASKSAFSACSLVMPHYANTSITTDFASHFASHYFA